MQQSIWNNIIRKIEKYRVGFGLFLVCLILGAGIYNIYFNTKASIQKENPEILSLKNENEQLRSQLNDLENKHNALVEEFSKINIVKEKQVAGASTEKVYLSKEADADISQISLVNINTASASQLDELPGIGATYSQRIIEYRNINNGFKTKEELMNVKGIGEKTFEKIKNLIEI